MSYTPNPLVAGSGEAAVLAAADGTLDTANTDGVVMTNRNLNLNGHTVAVTIDNPTKTITFQANNGDFTGVVVGDTLEVASPPFSDFNKGAYKVTGIDGTNHSFVTAQRVAGQLFQCVAESVPVTSASQVVAFAGVPPMPGYTQPTTTPYLDLVKGPFKAAMIALMRSLNLLAEGWHAASLLNSWANLGSYATAGYYKDPLGTVWLKGTVSGGTVGANAFVLPTGYRPLERRVFIVQTWSGGTGQTSARIDIMTDGSVYVYTGQNGMLSFDGIAFRAEQ